MAIATRNADIRVRAISNSMVNLALYIHNFFRLRH
jgi:hypothetical protein